MGGAMSEKTNWSFASTLLDLPFDCYCEGVLKLNLIQIKHSKLDGCCIISVIIIWRHSQIFKILMLNLMDTVQKITALFDLNKKINMTLVRQFFNKKFRSKNFSVSFCNVFFQNNGEAKNLRCFCSPLV